MASGNPVDDAIANELGTTVEDGPGPKKPIASTNPVDIAIQAAMSRTAAPQTTPTEPLNAVDRAINSSSATPFQAEMRARIARNEDPQSGVERQTPTSRSLDPGMAAISTIDLPPGSPGAVEEQRRQDRLMRQVPGQVAGLMRFAPAIMMAGVRTVEGRLFSALSVVAATPESLHNVVFGVETPDQLREQRFQLMSDPNKMSEAIAQLDATRAGQRAATRNPNNPLPLPVGADRPATVQDVWNNINQRINEAQNVTSALTAEQQAHLDVADRILNNHPETTRAAAALNIGRNLAMFVGTPVTIVAVMAARIANDFRDAVKAQNDPNISSDETDDKWMAATSNLAMLYGIGRGIAERRSENNRLNALNAANSARDAAAINEIHAAINASRLAQLRQAVGVKEPATVISSDVTSTVDPVASLISAHFANAPDAITVIPGLENPVKLLAKIPPNVRESIMNRMVSFKNKDKTHTVYLYGPDSPLADITLRKQVAAEGFYSGQRVSVDGQDYIYNGRLTPQLARVSEVGTTQEAIRRDVLGTPTDKISITGSYSDPQTFREELERRNVPDGVYDDGSGNIARVTNRVGEYLPQFRSEYDFKTRRFNVFERNLRSTDIRDEILYHHTNADVSRASDLSVDMSGKNFGSMNVFKGIYLSTEGTDNTFGRNVVRAKLTPDAKVINFGDLFTEWRKSHGPEQSLNDYAKEHYDVVVNARDAVGNSSDIAVLNPKVLRDYAPSGSINVNHSDIRLTNGADNLHLNPTTAGAAFDLYQQWKAKQPAPLGDTEINQLTSALAEVLGTKNIKSLRAMIAGREAELLRASTIEPSKTATPIPASVIENSKLPQPDTETAANIEQARLLNEGADEVPSALPGHSPDDYRSVETLHLAKQLVDTIGETAITPKSKAHYEPFIRAQLAELRRRGLSNEDIVNKAAGAAISFGFDDAQVMQMLDNLQKATTPTNVEVPRMIRGTKFVSEEALSQLAMSNGMTLDRSMGRFVLRKSSGEILASYPEHEASKVIDFINSTGQAAGEELSAPTNVPPEVGGPVPPSIPNAKPSDVPDEFNYQYNNLGHGRVDKLINGLFGWTRNPWITRATAELQKYATLTNGRVDLATIAGHLKEGLRINEAEALRLSKTLGFDDIINLRKKMTADQLSQITTAKETMSAVEARADANEDEASYADRLIALHSQDTPLDLQRVYEYGRRAVEGPRNAKALGWTPEQIDADLTKLLDHYKFSPNNKIAVVIEHEMRSSAEKDVSMRKVLRIVDSTINNGMTTDEFMARNNFTPEMRALTNKLIDVDKAMATYDGLDDHRLITKYATHMKNSYDPMPWEIRQLFGGSEDPTGAGSFHNWAEDTRTGELKNYERDPVVAATRRVLASVKNKTFKAIYDAGKAELIKRADSIQDDNIRKEALRSIDDYLNGLNNRLAPSDGALNESAAFALKSFGMEEPPKGLISNMVRLFSAHLTGALQGGKPGIFFRDIASVGQMLNMRFSPDFAFEAFKAGFGNIKFNADGSLHADMFEQRDRARALGIQGQGFGNRFAVPENTTDMNSVQKAGMLFEAIHRLAASTSGQEFGYSMAEMGVYQAARARALKTISKLMTMESPSPDAVTKLMNDRNNVTLEAYTPEFRTRFMELVNSNQAEQAAHELGLQTVQMVVPQYGYAEGPRGWRTVTGRLMGRYGQYSVFTKDAMADIASYGSLSYRTGALLRLGASQVAMAGLEHITGQSFGSYKNFFFAPFTGSPAWNLSMDMAKIMTSNNQDKKDKLLGLGKQLIMSQVPFSAAASQLKNQPDGLQRDLTLTHPQ